MRSKSVFLIPALLLLPSCAGLNNLIQQDPWHGTYQGQATTLTLAGGPQMYQGMLEQGETRGWIQAVTQGPELIGHWTIEGQSEPVSFAAQLQGQSLIAQIGNEGHTLIRMGEQTASSDGWMDFLTAFGEVFGEEEPPSNQHWQQWQYAQNQGVPYGSNMQGYDAYGNAAGYDDYGNAYAGGGYGGTVPGLDYGMVDQSEYANPESALYDQYEVDSEGWSGGAYSNPSSSYYDGGYDSYTPSYDSYSYDG